MNESNNVKKFLNCNKHCTTECPYRDDPAMERICDVIEKWRLIPGKPIDILTNADYERTVNLYEKCDAFTPESNEAK